MIDNYATWDTSKATDEPDGFPDRALVPLITALRRAGRQTLQSCAGHIGSSDGLIWFASDALGDDEVQEILLQPVFDRVVRVFKPEERWEIGWNPRDLNAAIAGLAMCLGLEYTVRFPA
jgi:hypothetical protein